MDPNLVISEINAASMATFIFAGPLLIAAAVIGLLIAVFQAATQIQEQTISQIVKILVLSAGLVASGGALVSPLVQHAEHILNDFPDMVR
ncbi:flagellar biosynthetic protein FliQ [Rhizobium sp. FKY42]|uniref:flagellar biosynthetic protein FliQ n=1 Tax=Rhizobium sp. FKY42 TaxID=2562310 RepID=UPI0010C09394|nr:flagellar biosynthetic protein FliQ [Rhizobium sp. FKY42]